MITVQKTFTFDAAHKLDDLEDNHPCMRLHGHTYNVTVAITGSPVDLNAAGMLIDFRRLQPFKDYIDGTLDHQYLNDIVEQPTSENLAVHLWNTFCRIMWDQLKSHFVVSITVSETPKSHASYIRRVG